MRWSALWVLGLGFAACAPKESGIRTPDEYVAEQEQLADEQAKAKAARGDDRLGADDATDTEEQAKWDQSQAELELKRATRSAQTCPEALTAEEQAKVERGVAKVTLVFVNTGHAKTATIEPPHSDTPVGKCVLRALSAVIVPAFVGDEQTVSWEVDLSKVESDADKTKDKGSAKKSKK